MRLSDGDLEFVLRLYAIGKQHMQEKELPDYATDIVAELMDNGLPMAEIAEELSEYDTYLAQAVEELVEQEEDEESYYGYDEEEDY